MTVKDIAEKLSLKTIAGQNSLNKEAQDCYIGDLLSWVLGNAKPNDIWITVMGNISAIGVASMVEASCIILSEGSWLDDDAKQKADEHDVAVLLTKLSSYEVAIKISELLKSDSKKG